MITPKNISEIIDPPTANMYISFDDYLEPNIYAQKAISDLN